MSSSELEIKRALRRYHARFDDPIEWREIFDRCLDYLGAHPNASIKAVVDSALQPDRAQPRTWWLPPRRRGRRCPQTLS